MITLVEIDPITYHGLVGGEYLFWFTKLYGKKYGAWNAFTARKRKFLASADTLDDLLKQLSCQSNV